METVLVTGITGYIGAHIALRLLNEGYKVIGTTRDIEKTDRIKTIISTHSKNHGHLSLAAANLMDDQSVWQPLMKRVDYVMHVASPLPRVFPKNHDDLIIPAKTGVLNVLQAAASSSVKRVVYTSSISAIIYGVEQKKTFVESDWTDANNLKETNAYIRSKTIAEKAAWQFMANHHGELELSVINPAVVLGPVLDKNDYGTSAALILKMMDGSLPAIPKIGYSLVDVRSVADMHIKAMKTPGAAGERFICANTYAMMTDIVDVLRKRFPDRKFPKSRLPDFLVRLFAKIDKETAPILVELGAERRHDNTKARNILNWNPISDEQSILDTAESLIELDFVK